MASGGDDDDEFLRAVAKAPAREPPAESLPERVGHFRIVERIGRGGMGVVYRAVDERLRRDVALKVLPLAFESDTARRSRFMREARAASAVAHPNLVTIHEIGEADGRVFIAMELIAGRTLRQRLVEGRLPLDEALRIARELCLGVAIAHERGVVHRDLKPDNVMLAEDGAVKILDFGLAKQRAADPEQADTQTKDGHIVGTPDYMSPEQAVGAAVDERGDVFALGITIYEMLGSQRPFRGGSSAEVVAAILRDRPAPLRSLAPQVPRSIEAAVMRCLEKSTGDRWPNARALLEALSGAAPAPGLPGSARSWAMAAVLAIAAGALGIVWKGRRADGRSTTVTASVGGGVALACPQLEASGVEEPAGWLGAAAANLTCRRAAIAMDGRLEHVLVPAELLGLPRQPTDDFPQDPYGAADARARAIAVAKQRAQSWLDGAIHKKPHGFQVTLIVRAPDGGERGRADGAGKFVGLAVRDAMQRLFDAGTLPKVAQIDAETARWSGVRDVGLALDLDDWHTSIGHSPEWTRAAEATLAARKAELGPLWPAIQFEGGPTELLDRDRFDPVTLDRSTPEAFVHSVRSYVFTVAFGDSAALSTEAGQLCATETSVLGRRTLENTQAELHWNSEKALPLVLAGLQEEPRSAWAWDFASNQATPQRFAPIASAYAGWIPESPAGWMQLAFGLKDPVQRVRFAQRGHALANEHPPWATDLGKKLLKAGRSEEVRSLAASMIATGPHMRSAADALSMLVDCGATRFGAALARGLVALSKIDGRFAANVGDYPLFDATIAAATLTGRGREVGDAFAQRFVLVDPPSLARGVLWNETVFGAVDACMIASPELATQCFARLRKLLKETYFLGVGDWIDSYIDGAERYSRGDLRGAAKAWLFLVGRDLSGLRAGRAIVRFAPIALDAAGEHVLAARIDAEQMTAGFDTFAGVSPAHVREAHRALARGDKKKARALAKQIIDAWGAADVPVPAVAEMRQLLVKTN
jgi:hypothetical protein